MVAGRCDGWVGTQPSQRPATINVKPEAAITVFQLLILGGVSPETCWAIKKHWNNKFYYTVASCWFILWDSNRTYSPCRGSVVSTILFNSFYQTRTRSIPFILSMILNGLTPSNTAIKLTHFFPFIMPWSTWTRWGQHNAPKHMAMHNPIVSLPRRLSDCYNLQRPKKLWKQLAMCLCMYVYCDLFYCFGF